MKEKKKTRSELKHEAIVNAAKRAFQAEGVQNTSMDKVAEMAQVSKRTVYNHFAAKEELVLYVISDLWREAMIQAEVEYRPDESIDDQLTRLVEAEIELVSSPSNLGLARVAIGYFLHHPERLQAEVGKLKAQETVLHRWLQAAVDDGKLKPMDVQLAVSQLHNLVKGTCYWPQLLHMEAELSDDQKGRLAKESVAIFLSHYQT